MPRKRDSNEYEESALFGEQFRSEQEKQPWDYFKNTPVKIATGSMIESKYVDNSVKILKVLTYFFNFLVILGAAVISKGTLLFMTSQVQPNQTKTYCKQLIDRNKEYVVQLPRVERTAWIWILIFTYFVPELLTFLRSVRMCLFKSWKMPSKMDMFSVFLTESLPAIGSALLVFSILPELDVVKGVMLTNAVCFVPALVGFFSRKNNDNMLKMTLDILSILAQATSFIVWPMIENKPSLWLIPVSVLFISFGWWENYVSRSSPIDFIRRIGQEKKNFKNSRYFIYIFVSVWKCLIFFVTTIVIIHVKEGSASFLFSEFSEAFEQHTINITEIRPVVTDQIDFGETLPIGNQKAMPADYLTPVWLFLINIVCTWICYIFGKFSCKIMIQGFSYAFPINLAVPTTISLLIAICGIHNGNPCVFYPTIPNYLFFNSPPIYFLQDFITSQHVWIWVLWLLSQTWITIHIWHPQCERLARTENLYVKPMYDAFLIDQSIALNRRRDDKPENDNEKNEEYDEDNLRDNTKYQANNECTITKIYACACMWHETKEEMIEFLKSIFRLDEDQWARRYVKDNIELKVPADYYELETHIFFDDAFIRKDIKDNDPKVNEYVKTLIEIVDKAATEVHQKSIRVRPPQKYLTPYGGRLEWTLPGNTVMIAHLKDTKKIRKKKRWSQVMYMYYLFGHRLMEREDLLPNEKDILSQNTYLLALDGDVDFQPEAMHLLVDLMKKNKGLGAACGRIHPLGSGPMAWYQMFEYAIGHWLQKATEHMIGCVLCSPGCFSLFRAKALMDNRVMCKYATKSEKAHDFVQYDQGEDRWLCNLLLQRGFRVEYSAASDAYTHCPEGFNEFYNQRRRWIPSTTANILDLLTNYKRTIKINDNISRLYIVYQTVLMIGTILGPGTIFLMLVGAFVAAFQLDQWSSFLWNVVPILFYMMICVMFKSDVQLLFAGIVSALYGLIMMAVLVGVMLQITTDGVLAPSSLFFFCIAGEMIITALMHPKELNCLIYGVVYYVTVPSMYMLLVIYSIFNLNNVSWGTREVTIEPEPKKEENEENEEEEEKKEEPKHKIFSLFGSDKNEKTGSFEFSIAGLFKCLLCTHSNSGEENEQLSEIMGNLKQLTDKIQSLEWSLNNNSPEPTDKPFIQEPQRRRTILEGSKGREVMFQGVDNGFESDVKSLISDITDEDELPNWTEDKALGRGNLESLSPREKVFWEGLINKYLYPYEDNQKKVASDLKDLRDKSVMAFFMINAIFVLVVFLLTLKKDLLHVDWPLDIKYNFTYLDDISEIQLSATPLELEPIGFVFLIFFFSLLVVQFIAMLFHRFSTFSQILSTTYINWNIFSKLNKEKLTADEILARNPVKAVKRFLRTNDEEDDEDEEDEKEVSVERRKTVQKLAESGNKRTSVINLTEEFERRLTIKPNYNSKGSRGAARKSIAAAIHQRRSTVHFKKSVQFRTSTNAYDNGAFNDSEL